MTVTSNTPIPYVILSIILSLFLTVATNYAVYLYNLRLLANNAIFIMAFAIIIFLLRRRYDVYFLHIILSALVFILMSVLTAFVALFLPDKYLFLGDILIYPIISIGYYPQGPDVPFLDGLSIWGLSTMLVIIGGGFLGIIIHAAKMRLMNGGRAP